MTLADIRGWVRGKLGDSQYDASLIDAAANWHVFDLLANNRIRFMEENDTLTASTGDTSVDFPDDFQTILLEGFIATSPNLTGMKDIFYEYGDFMSLHSDFSTATANTVFAWTDFANAARFGAPLSANTTFNCDYIRRPDTMTNDTDECEIPDQYQELVVLGTLKRCMETNEDYGEAQQELANLDPLRTTFIRNEGRGNLKTGPTIMRSNRRGRTGGMGLRTGGW